MFGFSMSELVLTSVVGLLCLKRADIKLCLDALNAIKEQIRSLHAQLNTPVVEWKMQDQDEINEYLKLIAGLGYKYDGEYALEHVRAKYKELVENIDVTNLPQKCPDQNTS